MTDDDWAEINTLMQAYQVGGEEALLKAMNDLKKHDEYTNKVMVPKFGKILPGVH